MSLEMMIDCLRTLKKLRGGPLGDLLDGFCSWLLERGFKRASIRKHLSCVSHLNEYLRAQKQVVVGLSHRDIQGFFNSYPSWCRNRGPLERHIRVVKASIYCFVEFLCAVGKYEAAPVKQATYQPLLDAYLKWMSKYQGAAPGTLSIRAYSLAKFLQWLGPQATCNGMAMLTPNAVEDFCIRYYRKMGRHACRSMQSALRTFFRFCLHQGYIQQPLDHAVPTLRTYKLSTVPRGLNDAQSRKVIQSIDRSTANGRRAYAICQLLYTYGVRGGQLRALRLQDINWAENLILFRALKHGKDSLLPLTEEVGESLLDYLQFARPSCIYPEVFLTTRAPYHPILGSFDISYVVSKHIRAAGIDIPSKGAHVFRHGFASRMLTQGHSLKEIADVLGHRHLATTFIYTKVDFNALKMVGLKWPQEVEL